MCQQLPAQQPDFTVPVWVADQGDGTYTNPILHTDYSDPDAIRVGDDYYMTASSFNCIPGLPILHSKDLVTWRLINYALPQQYPLPVFNQPQHFKGVWAPCLRYHEGEFFIYYGDPDFGIYMLKTTDPAGAWSEPTLVLAGQGLIDPSPLWDDDGQVYLVHGWAASRAQVNSLLTVHRLNKEGTQTIGPGRHVFDGHDAHPTIEGPKFYRRDGYYYIFAPAGGVATGWQLVMRSKNIWGPYTEKIVLEQGKTPINGPHQGAWVETQTGESWFLHFQDKEAYGRIVHLQPMQWREDGWPVIGSDPDGDGTGEPVLRHPKPNVGKVSSLAPLPESDDFNGSDPNLHWQWQANRNPVWAAQIPGSGYLRLFALPQPADFRNHWQTPNLLLQKFPATNFTATTKIKFTPSDSTQRTGLIIMGRNYSSLELVQQAQGLQLRQVICKQADKGGAEVVVARQAAPATAIYLRVTVTAPEGVCRFSYSTDGKRFQPFGEPFTAAAGGWIGAKLGLFCDKGPRSARGGYVDVDWFHLTGQKP
ncbi:MAG: glycosyl hydrolase 43 family protein [Lewinellaceae bacterium]|nr:glycosyl hydrolase 43 family protein [Lewinellaceae bacterium]